MNALLKSSALTLAAVLFFFSGCSEKHHSAQTEIHDSATRNANPHEEKKETQELIVDNAIAYKMASIDAGYQVESDDLAIVGFNYYLNELQKKTSLQQTEIADMLVYSWKEIAIKNYSLDLSLMDLTKGVHDSIPENNPAVSKNDFSFLIVAFIKVYMNSKG